MAGETTAFVADEAWRKAAKRRLGELGRGALAQMARELAAKNGMRGEEAARSLSSIFSRIINGWHSSSDWIGQMSIWLQIERPTERLRDVRLQNLVDMASELDDEDLVFVEGVMARLRRGVREGGVRGRAGHAEPVTPKGGRRSDRRGRDDDGEGTS